MQNSGSRDGCRRILQFFGFQISQQCSPFFTQVISFNMAAAYSCLGHRRFILCLTSASRGAVLRWGRPPTACTSRAGAATLFQRCPVVVRCRRRLAWVRKGLTDAQLCDGSLSRDAITLLQKCERRWNCTGRNWRAPRRDCSLIEFRTYGKPSDNRGGAPGPPSLRSARYTRLGANWRSADLRPLPCASTW